MNMWKAIIWWSAGIGLMSLVSAQCPWSSDLANLHSHCVCSVSIGQQVTIRCSKVDLMELANAFRGNQSEVNRSYVTISTLYVNNCTVGSDGVLRSGLFDGIRVSTLQLTQCRITNLTAEAFRGLDESLATLGLQQNGLSNVPTEALRGLRALTHLDLSGNDITIIDESAFDGLHLRALKLSDMKMDITKGAFKGLEQSLRNLNLKGTSLTEIPEALGNLSSLAFLDLAQNAITSVPVSSFQSLRSLTALNLERNLIQDLAPSAFASINDTLSSLSLLNNRLQVFPLEALAALTELRVLDLGFNGLQTLPGDAFQAMLSLTLLALDGNPLSTIPSAPFAHLNQTIRGLSIGGKQLECDCRLRWISEWIRDHDLQVTSRERSPQFCGRPEALRSRSLPQMSPEEFVCVHNDTNPSLDTDDPEEETEVDNSITSMIQFEATPRSISPAPRMDSSYGTSGEPRVVKATRQQDGAVLVRWEAMDPTGAGDVRLAYRLFGEDHFRLSTAVGGEDREFRLRGVPATDCLQVCVVRLSQRNPRPDKANLPANSLPLSVCKEVRGERATAGSGSEADKVVIIAASAAICASVIVAVVIFVCCNRQRARREMRQMQQQQQPLPPPLPMLMPPPIKMDWDNGSLYSTRSIPRPRIYIDKKGGTVNSGFLADEDTLASFNHMHPSHINGESTKARPYKPRMTGDGQSQRAQSVMSNHPLTMYNTLPHPYALTSLSAKSHHHYRNPLPHHGSMTTNNYRKKRKFGKGPPRSAMSSVGSFQSLSGYDPDGMFKWTDHDIDVYGQNDRNPVYGQREFH